MVHIFSNEKSRIGQILEGLGMEEFGILWPFGIYYVHWEYIIGMYVHVPTYPCICRYIFAPRREGSLYYLTVLKPHTLPSWPFSMYAMRRHWAKF
jgi:hypothetical protein